MNNGETIHSAGILARQPRSFFFLVLLASFEFFIAGIVTLLISPDPKNAFFLGFSPLRMALVGVIWILAAITLWAGWFARRKRIPLESIWLVNRDRLLRCTTYAFSFMLIIWGWLALFCSPQIFGRKIYIFQRIQPISVAVGVVLAECWIYYLISQGRFNFHGEAGKALQRYVRPILAAASALVALEIFIVATKFGLLSNIIYANVPGIPLTGIQWLFIVLAGCFWIALVWPLDKDQPFIRFLNKYWIIPLLIFLAALLTWGLTPMVRHYFSLEPAAPSYQPFPYSDARFYDQGGISILRGFGVFFHILIDKPLYMILLAGLHLIAGQNYNLIIWLQLVILAFIPVVFFQLGRRFHGTALGICLALVMIIRQRNAIVLSFKISSTNPKLLMSEQITLLAMILLVYLAFRWLRERRLWQAVLCGAVIGAASLIRLNPLFLFPALFIFIFLSFRLQGRNFVFRQLTAFTLAFIVVLLPWLISSVDPQGNPWLLTKIRLVVEQRYGTGAPPALPQNVPVTAPSDGFLPTPSLSPSGDVTPSQPPSSANLEGGTVPRFFYHVLHNYSTSVMALPLSFIYTDLEHVAQRDYWKDGGVWNGGLTPIELGLILIDLLFVAIGLGFAWKRFSWAGMVPLMIYLVYVISLGFAMNSGGRYLVPIDWIIYFYYFLGLVALAQFYLRHITRKQGMGSSIVETVAPIRPQTERRSLGLSAGLTVFLAVLFPLANSTLPALHSPIQDQPDVQEARIVIGGLEPPGTTIIYGEILYPYFSEEKLTFDLITSAGATTYLIPHPAQVVNQFQDGQYAFITTRNDSQGRPQLESIYFWQDESPALVWRSSP